MKGRAGAFAVIIGIALAVDLADIHAQRGRGGGAPATPPATPQASAPIDLTGYWVSLITEDWRIRMTTPAKGDYQGVPLTPEGRKVADAWDSAADTAAGNQCKAYGAPAIMRMPGRLHITWQDATTLKIETDAGTQTRLVQWGASSPAAARSWQGQSVGLWERPGGGRGAAPPAGARPGGSLKVVTTNLRSGYLRRNGVPYSEGATLTEYFDVGDLRGGGQVLLVTSVTEDPRYLTQLHVTTSQFKKETDASKWDPSPCTATW